MTKSSDIQYTAAMLHKQFLQEVPELNDALINLQVKGTANGRESTFAVAGASAYAGLTGAIHAMLTLMESYEQRIAELEAITSNLVPAVDNTTSDLWDEERVSMRYSAYRQAMGSLSSVENLLRHPQPLDRNKALSALSHAISLLRDTEPNKEE